MLQRNCEFFNKHKQNLDIVISATRSKGATYNTLNDYARSQNSNIIWLRKLVSNNNEIQTELNNIDTYLIVDFILNTVFNNKKHHKLMISQSFQFETV